MGSKGRYLRAQRSEPPPTSPQPGSSASHSIAPIAPRRIRIEGFIYPLKAGEAHDYFLLSGLPPSCPFCLPGGPADMVEVMAARPVPHSIEPVMLTGRFEVLEDDPTGLLYRLHDARAVE